MTRIRRLVFAGAAAVFVLAIGCNRCSPPAECTLSVILHPQEQGLWCWAASGQMVMEFHQLNVRQCEEANILFHQNGCCPGGPIDTSTILPSGCNQGGSPPLNHYGLLCDTNKSNSLSWDQVRRQIYCKHLPFLWTWQLAGGGEHMVVVAGYSSVGGTNMVLYADPSSNPDPENNEPGGDFGHTPYEIYRNGIAGAMWHAEDLYNIRRRP